MNSDEDPVLHLGRDLADALDRSDVLGRWMSHHLAELITRCEASPDDLELAETTRGVVLKLWEHKSGARFKREPYAYVRPVLRAIARLDPDPDPWAHYRPFGDEVPSAEALASYPMLQKACDIDREVGNLIRLSVAVAAREATSREERWVITGMETAQTEEDKALNVLAQLRRRLGLQEEPDLGGSEELSDQAIVESEPTDPAAPATDERTTRGHAEPGDSLNDAPDAYDSAEALTGALLRAVVRSRQLIDQLASLCEELITVGVEVHAGPTDASLHENQGPDRD